MKYEKFKDHVIKRTCQESFDKPRKYKPYLQKDFHRRCCYCNMPEDLLTVPYHVEHFIPENAFKGIKDSLMTDYKNLMWSCPKCNLSKGEKFSGDIRHNNKIENKLFYNPVETDYNNIFYRNELGGIDSDDPKGREMIKILKLYRPVHNFALLYERYEKLAVKLEQQQKEETDPERKRMLESAAGKVAMKCVKIGIAFRAVYRDSKC
nr:HNH endonuclease [uncultured Acetatifactor sp.]